MNTKTTTQTNEAQATPSYFKSVKIKTINYAAATAPIDEMTHHIKSLLSQWGYQFEPGLHNDYIVQFATLCIRYGIEEKDALHYAASEFGSQYGKTLSVMKSCYKHTEHFGEWHFFRKGEEVSKRHKLKVVKQWLSTHYEFHHNEVTESDEIRSRMVITGKYPLWTLVDDNIVHSLCLEMNEAGIKALPHTIRNVISYAQ